MQTNELESYTICKTCGFKASIVQKLKMMWLESPTWYCFKSQTEIWQIIYFCHPTKSDLNIYKIATRLKINLRQLFSKLRKVIPLNSNKLQFYNLSKIKHKSYSYNYLKPNFMNILNMQCYVTKHPRQNATFGKLHWDIQLDVTWLSPYDFFSF